MLLPIARRRLFTGSCSRQNRTETCRFPQQRCFRADGTPGFALMEQSAASAIGLGYWHGADR